MAVGQLKPWNWKNPPYFSLKICILLICIYLYAWKTCQNLFSNKIFPKKLSNDISLHFKWMHSFRNRQILKKWNCPRPFLICCNAQNMKIRSAREFWISKLAHFQAKNFIEKYLMLVRARRYGLSELESPSEYEIFGFLRTILTLIDGLSGIQTMNESPN